MIVKDVCLGEDARQELIKGIDIIADAVKTTLGARGRTVVIESNEHIGGITVTKDGVTVANSITLIDAIQNMAVMMMRQAASKTAGEAGDGTTTAIVLAQAIIHQTLAQVSDNVNITEVLRAIQANGDRIVELLDAMSDKVDEKMLIDVATISANNDNEIGSIIAEAYNTVGRHGVVTVENADGANTYQTVSEGMRIERGYMSRYFITDKKTNECVLDKPYILVLDQQVETMAQIEHVLADILTEGKSVLIIGSLSQNVINTLNLNRARNNMKVCAIMPPQFGWKSHELMEDIALATGATYFSEDTGDNLQLVRRADLGQCEKAVISSDHTLLITSDENKEAINERVDTLWEEHDSSKDQDFVKERIAIISGRIGVIHVGANSDIEQKEKRDRVDDAVCATRAALEDGILPGGGVALRDIASMMSGVKGDTVEERVALSILDKALRVPHDQILDNAALTKPSKKARMGYGVDVKRDKRGDMVKMGVIDPTKVTKTAVTNAISVATTILSTNAVITTVRQKG